MVELPLHEDPHAVSKVRRDLGKRPATRLTIGSGANRARSLDNLKRPGEVHDDARDLHLRPEVRRRIICRGKRADIEPRLAFRAEEPLVVFLSGKIFIAAHALIPCFSIISRSVL